MRRYFRDYTINIDQLYSNSISKNHTACHSLKYKISALDDNTRLPKKKVHAAYKIKYNFNEKKQIIYYNHIYEFMQWHIVGK